jgi:alpha-beta hydrolase superfamily lysophospholipase
LGEFEEEKYVVRKLYLDSKLRNVRLYHTKFTPASPKRTIAVIHGFGEHSGRFYDIAHFFAIHEFEVLLVDFTGFGYSGGPRGCATLEILENDVITLLGQARPELPLYMYAHSLGGLTTIKLLLDRPLLKVSGCILTSPLLGMPKDRRISKVKLWVVKELGDELEDLIVNSMINPTALTKNNKYMHNIFEDRLMIPFVGVKMAKSILESLSFVRQKMDAFSFPVIVFHGKKDSVVDFEDSKKFVYNKLAPYKQLHLFDEGYHEMQHDEEKDELLERGLRFL